jgi:hypothetical protein
MCSMGVEGRISSNSNILLTVTAVTTTYHKLASDGKGEEGK